MPRKVATALTNKAAMRLIEELGGQLDREHKDDLGRRAYFLSDGRYLTELDENRSWRLWPSVQVFRNVVLSVVTGQAHDPVETLIPDPRVFVDGVKARVSDLLMKAGVAPSSSLSDALPKVDALVLSRSGDYWTNNKDRFWMLCAYLGELLRERTGGAWVGEGNHAVVKVPNGPALDPGTAIVCHADEAPRGGFALGPIVRELLTDISIDGATSR
ncbi:MAG: hypothetical protein SFV15_22655 [Polyangiaceae bacterium]|nr:hypothetical protein [Polyangiaceae bacterium]